MRGIGCIYTASRYEVYCIHHCKLQLIAMLAPFITIIRVVVFENDVVNYILSYSVLFCAGINLCLSIPAQAFPLLQVLCRKERLVIWRLINSSASPGNFLIPEGSNEQQKPHVHLAVLLRFFHLLLMISCCCCCFLVRLHRLRDVDCSLAYLQLHHKNIL